jgi:DNA-binding transcriptional regulator YdaS (Cro superfamily)
MKGHLETTKSIAASDRVIDRLPVFSALAVLGMSYAEIGRLLGVTTMAVSYWATGQRPIDPVRRFALEYVAGRLCGNISKQYPLNNRYARRAEIAIKAAKRWSKLSRDELIEETGGILYAEELERGFELGKRILARLEQQ